MNGDGVISNPEMSVAICRSRRPAPVDYDYRYLSYSVGVNYRIAEPVAVFARYSRGGRANADRMLFSPIVSMTTGKPDRRPRGSRHGQAGRSGREVPQRRI
jgi:outer membrane receptor protein involved in Fe transport